MITTGIILFILTLLLLTVYGVGIITVSALLLSLVICALGILNRVKWKERAIPWLKYAVAELAVCTLVLFSFARPKPFLLTLSKDPKTAVSDEEIKRIDTLITDRSYEEAKSALDAEYKGKVTDDTYNLLSARIILATDSNKSNAIDTIRRVKNHSILYYRLLIQATAATPFTQGKVPRGLLDAVQDAVRDFPEETDFVFLAAALCYEADMYESSAYYCIKGIELEPENARFHYYYALDVYLMGDTDEGIASLETARSYTEDGELLDSIDTYIRLMKEGVR